MSSSPTIEAATVTNDVDATSVVDSAVPASDASEEWRNWPENCRNFRRELDDPWIVQRCFGWGEREDQARPKDTEVFHVTEYSGDGTKLLDRFLTEQESEEYFAGTTQNEECKVRLFFASSDWAGVSVRQSYIRRWFSHYSVPIDVAAAFTLDTSAFGSFTEDVPVPTGAPSRQIIHLWLCCDSNLPPLDEKDLEYCRGEMHAFHSSRICLLSDRFVPSIYIQYDTFSKEVTVLSFDLPPIHCALRRACENGSVATILADPFLFLVSYLSCLHRRVQALCIEWSNFEFDTTSDIAPKDYSTMMQDLAIIRGIYRRSATALNLVEEWIHSLCDAHEQFATTWHLDDGFVKGVDDNLHSIARDFHAMAERIKSLHSMSEGFTDILLGLTQIQNGNHMRIIAEENQKQAAAAKADNELMKRIALDSRKDSKAMKRIAFEAKRDSEIMKTITVVTLIYLPATFVCTLLSMGMFEWPTQDDKAGHVKIARTGWIFLALAIPLTIMTCSIAWWKYSDSSKKAHEQFQKDEADRKAEVGGQTSGEEVESDDESEDPTESEYYAASLHDDVQSQGGVQDRVATQPNEETDKDETAGGGLRAVARKMRRDFNPSPYVSSRLRSLRRRLGREPKPSDRADDQV